MARKGLSKCVAVIIGGAIGGSIAGGGVGAAIEAIPSVTSTISIPLAFAIPSVLGLVGAIGAGGFAWGSTTECDKQPPDNGGSGPQSDRSGNQGMIIVRERVIIVWAIMFIAVLLPQVTRFAFSSVFSKQSLLVVQIVMAAIAFCIWVIGTCWLYNQGVTARRRRQELSQLGTLEQIPQVTQHETGLPDETSIKTHVYDLSEGFLALRMKGQVAAFHTVWEKLKTLPLEILAGSLGQSPAATSGLGFAGVSQQLLPVISTISWVVINWPSLSQMSVPEEINALIVKEAKAHGCSLALSYALAHYLQAQLSK